MIFDRSSSKTQIFYTYNISTFKGISKIRRFFQLFIILNIMTSFILGIICLFIDNSLSENSPNAFIAVLVFTMLNILSLFFSFLLISLLSCCLFLFKNSLKPAIVGCIPLIYKLGLYIFYIAIFPFCFVIFFDENAGDLEEITFFFLIYQMIVAIFFLMDGCYEIFRKETRSEYLMEIESQKSLYQIDDNEIELLQREIADSREKFKGSLH